MLTADSSFLKLSIGDEEVRNLLNHTKDNVKYDTCIVSVIQMVGSRMSREFFMERN